MKRIATVAIMAALAAGTIPHEVVASGSSGASMPHAPAMSPEQKAVADYNRGLRYRNKAWKLEKKAGSVTGKDKVKLDSKLEGQFKKAVHAFEQAVAAQPNFYEAHGSLGYALRRQGEYAAALESYNRALSLNPNYPEAIEYRAEAYLGLNRPQDAQTEYSRLLILSPDHASELLGAINSWVEDRRANNQGLDPEILTGVASWAQERQQVARTTVSQISRKSNSW
ncbi:MAG: tetratricopeptide repeat protein [Thermoanaerobaculia bacterium]